MQYVHAALTETLRLYPAVPVDGKNANEDDLLPDGYKINIGDGISYMPYAMGRMTLSGERMLSNSALKDGLKMVFFLAESPYKFTAFQVSINFSFRHHAHHLKRGTSDATHSASIQICQLLLSDFIYMIMYAPRLV